MMKRAEGDPAGPLPLRAAPEPPALDDLVVHEPLHGIQRGLEAVLQLRERDPVARGEDGVEEELLVRRERRRAGRRCRPRQHPVVGAEDPLVVARDLQVTAHREVDERGRDVDEVDLLVEDRAHHPGLHPGRRGELHRHGRARPAHDDVRLLADARGQARREAGVLLVAPAAPHEQPHEPPGEQRQEDAEPDHQPAHGARGGGADDRAGVGVDRPLSQVGGEVAEGVAGVGREDAGPLLRRRGRAPRRSRCRPPRRRTGWSTPARRRSRRRAWPRRGRRWSPRPGAGGSRSRGRRRCSRTRPCRHRCR